SLPIGQQASLEGVVDLLSGEAYRYAADASGRRQKAEVPAALGGQVEGARKKLMEGAAEADDQLLEKYLGDGMLTAQEILQGVKSGVTTRSLFPVLCGCAGGGCWRSQCHAQCEGEGGAALSRGGQEIHFHREVGGRRHRGDRQAQGHPDWRHAHQRQCPAPDSQAPVAAAAPVVRP